MKNVNLMLLHEFYHSFDMGELKQECIQVCNDQQFYQT